MTAPDADAAAPPATVDTVVSGAINDTMGASASSDGTKGDDGTTINDKSTGWSLVSFHATTAISTVIIVLISLAVVAFCLKLLCNFYGTFSNHRRNRRIDSALDSMERSSRDQRAALLSNPIQITPAALSSLTPQATIPMQNLEPLAQGAATSQTLAHALRGPEGKIV